VPSRWVKISGLLTIIVIGAAAVLVASRWPFTRDKVAKALQKEFSSAVELKTFRATYFPPGFVAEAVTFRRNSDRNAPPIGTVEKLTIQGSYLGFFSIPKHIRSVKIEGLHIFASPSSESAGNEARAGPAPSTLVIDEIVADGSTIEVGSGEPGTEPLKFEIHKLTLNSVADDRPLSFHTELLIPEPPGEIRADGQFGRLQPQNLGQTQLYGSYSFQHADLGVFPGIRGTLSSTGKFNGLLERIEVEGSTDVPDFQVNRSDHTVRLRTQFRAIVNGMDGDVALESVHAQFERTSVISQGEVAHKAGSEGKTVSIAGEQNQGRIQDWLHLLSRADPPALNGAMNFRVQISVPPGKRSFIERVYLHGDFGIDAASFVRSTTQGSVDTLSQVAQGEKQNGDPASVVENLKGHVELRDAIATFSDFSFSVPGALARVHGTYGLLTEQINLHGTVRVDNKVSKGSTGIKSYLFKFVEPFLKKKNAGEIVPIKIGGSLHHATYGLDVVP
jgi:hypothetical protein